MLFLRDRDNGDLQKLGLSAGDGDSGTIDLLVRRAHWNRARLIKVFYLFGPEFHVKSADRGKDEVIAVGAQTRKSCIACCGSLMTAIRVAPAWKRVAGGEPRYH